MRYYKLYIDDKHFASLTKDNPDAPRVEFNFVSYAGAEVPNARIKIYNLSRQFFQAMDKMVGKKLEFYAGLSQENAMLKKAGYIQPALDLIGAGYIQSVIANPNAVPSSVEFILGVSPINKQGEGDSAKGIIFEVSVGDTLKDAFKTALTQLYSEVFVEIEGLPIVATQDEKIVFYSFSELLARAEKSRIAIYKTTRGYKITDEGKAGEQNTKLNLIDFLEQPHSIGLNKIQCALNLRGDLQINSLITIEGKIFATLGENAQFVANVPKVLVMGSYRITKLWHSGDSRNLNYQGWATNIEAVSWVGV